MFFLCNTSKERQCVPELYPNILTRLFDWICTALYFYEDNLKKNFFFKDMSKELKCGHTAHALAKVYMFQLALVTVLIFLLLSAVT